MADGCLRVSMLRGSLLFAVASLAPLPLRTFPREVFLDYDVTSFNKVISCVLQGRCRELGGCGPSIIKGYWRAQI